MLKDITIGQYCPAESAIHKLDPRVKIVVTIIYIVSPFVTNDWIGYLAAFLFLAACIVISKVPLSFILRGMKSIAVLSGITIVFNLIFTPGDDVLISFWKIKITEAGLKTGNPYGYLRLSFLYRRNVFDDIDDDTEPAYQCPGEPDEAIEVYAAGT